MIPTPGQLTLGDLIAALEAADPAQRVPLGFTEPHSYRGYYDELAFEVTADVTVGAMLADARSALGATYQGWKGGDYPMDADTPVWLVEREGTTGEQCGAVSLHLMLTAPVPSSREGGNQT